MAFYRVTAKTRFGSGSNVIEQGMSVEVASSYHPAPQGKEIVAAFQQKYGRDPQRAGGTGSSRLLIEKLG